MEQGQTPVTPEMGGTPTHGTQNNKTLIVVVVVLVVLALGYMVSSRFTGERMVERAVEQATGGAVDYDMNADGEGTIRVTGEDGAEMEYSVGGDVELPSSWPSDLPIIDDANITYAGTASIENGEPASVMYTTTKRLSAVSEYYTQALADNGWTVVSTMNTAGAVTMVVEKGEIQSGIYMAESEEGTSVIMSTNK